MDRESFLSRIKEWMPSYWLLLGWLLGGLLGIASGAEPALGMVLGMALGMIIEMTLGIALGARTLINNLLKKTFEHPISPLKAPIAIYRILLFSTSISQDNHHDAILCFIDEWQEAYEKGGRLALLIFYWSILLDFIKVFQEDRIEKARKISEAG